jgi:type 2A phosphatase activator TIP41
VKDSAVWKKKDMSKVKDFKQIEVISDWTYSTPYKGTVLRLSSAAKRVFLETSLQFPALMTSAGIEVPKSKLSIVPSKTELPLHRLGRDNPILHFGEVYLFEDDLGDQGYCCCNLRYRVMADCFYVLHRYYLRVDQVLVRIFDTRIFHSFDSNEVLREFTYKESTYDELRA